MACVESTTAAQAINSKGSEIAGKVEGVGGKIETGFRNNYNLMNQWRFSGVTSGGWQTANAIADATALAIGALNASIQWKISDLKQDLADSYYNMAKYKWDRFSQNYMPLEKKLLQEVANEPERKMNCNDDRNRAAQSVNSSYNMMQTYMARLRKSLHICIDDGILSMIELARSKMLTDTENYNLIDDKYWCDIMNDDRWNRRSNVLDLGRNISSLAMSYGSTAKQAMNAVGLQSNTAANSFVTAIGYFGARNDTVYPTTFMSASPLSTLGGYPGVQISSGELPRGDTTTVSGDSGTNG